MIVIIPVTVLIATMVITPYPLKRAKIMKAMVESF
jgi:hypothetical protein